MKQVIAAMALSLAAFGAQAAEPTYNCSINWSGNAQAARWFVGAIQFKGAGTMDCENNRTQTSSQLPIVVTVGSKAVGGNVGLSLGKLEVVAGTDADIKLFDKLTPYDLLGTYVVTQGQGSIFRGVGAFTAVKVGAPSLRIRMGLEVLKGFGLSVGVTTMAIDLDTEAELPGSEG